jgi:dTDP-4-dehydrorhamnose reductase
MTNDGSPAPDARGMRVVITGAHGLLAAAVHRDFQSAGAEVIGLDRAALDITDAATVLSRLAGARPDVIVNGVAYNNVDGAESDPVTALRVNAIGVRNLAAVASAVDATLVHYGTDFVFDGESNRPYVEDDPPNPRSVYGSSKLLGEWFAVDHPKSYMLRVESLFGEPGPESRRHGSLHAIVARIRARETTPVFVDRTVSPGYTTDIAAATRALVLGRAPYGIYHCVNSGATSWPEIATEASRLLGIPVQTSPVTLASMALPAKRPVYSALSNAKLAAAGVPMPTWQDALRRHLERS